jgi:hydantoinase/carbamoylase family amidase
MAIHAQTIDRARSTQRIERDIETLAGPDYTLSSEAIRRYAYTDVYRNTLDYFRRELEALEFEVYEDPVGTLVARNRPRGEPVFGVGSHCDSNRNGGKYDGTMGVVTALEVCRLSRELGLDLPLQLISFLEEEGSGFGQMLLGSRICAQRVTEEELKDTFRAIDDGRSFWEHAQDAGYEPERWRESIHILDDLSGWIELHIEQARVLEQAGDRLGVVTAIAGYIHADVFLEGRTDHAGATPMDLRLDAAAAAAEIVLAVERLAREAGNGTVGTVGEIELEPGIINVVPGKARLSLDTRGVVEEGFRSVAREVESIADEVAHRRGLTASYRQRQTLSATQMDERIVDALQQAAKASGEPFRLMPSGAAHDTMCVADHVPTAMVFVPCKAGISHSPLEDANPSDAALAAEVILNAVRTLTTA